MINHILNATRKVTNAVVVLLFAIVVVVVFSQVIARYAIGSSIGWADELSRYAFVWLVYLGGSITIREGRNVCFDLILDSLRGLKWKILFTILNIASIAFLVLVIYFGLAVCQAVARESSPIMKWPMAFVTAAVPLGGLLMFFEQIHYYIAHLNTEHDMNGETLL